VPLTPALSVPDDRASTIKLAQWAYPRPVTRITTSARRDIEKPLVDGKSLSDRLLRGYVGLITVYTVVVGFVLVVAFILGFR